MHEHGGDYGGRNALERFESVVTDSWVAAVSAGGRRLGVDGGGNVGATGKNSCDAGLRTMGGDALRFNGPWALLRENPG